MQNTRFEEIVFVGDFFRSSVNLLQSHPGNRRFLRGELDVGAMMRALVLALTPNVAGWASNRIADLKPLVELELLPRFMPHTLMVGWGMGPALLRSIC